MSFIETPVDFYQGVPCYVEKVPEALYLDSEDLEIYIRRFQWHSDQTSIFHYLLFGNEKRSKNILSVGEGTGEFIASLAAKYPSIQFFAFDLMPHRAVIAKKLVEYIGLKNVTVYIGSAESIPFTDHFFSGIIERGVFHILPMEVKLKHLREIDRICDGRVVMSHMCNARKYLIIRWFQSELHQNRKMWDDAIFTYRLIDKKFNTLSKMAKLINKITGHKVEILYHFRGDRELPYPSRAFHFLEYLGGITYTTQD